MLRRIKVIVPLLIFATVFLAQVACAQTDLSGEWGGKGIKDAADAEIGDYTGLPVNDQGRMRADSWDAEKWTQIEHECEPHPADYAVRGPSSMRVWSDLDPLTEEITAWHTTIVWMLPQRTIYMDGRPHPPEYAAHTWEGFSTGEWEADMLKVYTTHLKEGWLRRNGLPRSDRATMTEYFIRHGELLTLATIVSDPAYLSERDIRTSDWMVNLSFALTPSHCIPSNEIDHKKGFVPHHLPGTNMFLKEYAETYGIPYEAARGGAETMYPEYELKMATMPIPPRRVGGCKDLSAYGRHGC